MKITDIQRYPIALSVGSGDVAAQTIIVRVRTDSGLAGLGEATSDASDASRTLSTLVSWLKAYETALIGADALNINVVHHLLDRVSGQHPPGCQAARAAIDMAVHDLIGKARGCPVHEILGGAYRAEFELIAGVAGGSAEAAAAAARLAASGGFRGLKVGIGDDVLPPVQSIAQLEEKCRSLLAVLEAAGTDVYVNADANQSLGNPALVSRMFETVLAKHFHANLALQQPLHKLDLIGHAFLREKLPIPIILSESVVSPEAMMQIERIGAADRIGLSVERVGGLQNAMRIADICEAAAIGINPTVTSHTAIGMSAHCHLAAALHDPYPIDAGGCLSISESPVAGGPEIRNGHATLVKAPGLGVELDEDMLQSMVMKTDERCGFDRQ
ncbi:MAG: mandelate racemase/muconate lactonizing enzyme family protein [Aestuariivirga sp.]